MPELQAFGSLATFAASGVAKILKAETWHDEPSFVGENDFAKLELELQVLEPERSPLEYQQQTG